MGGHGLCVLHGDSPAKAALLVGVSAVLRHGPGCSLLHVSNEGMAGFNQ